MTAGYQRLAQAKGITSRTAIELARVARNSESRWFIGMVQKRHFQGNRI
jgi:hypothetical protein